jgi:hypothetical protein
MRALGKAAKRAAFSCALLSTASCNVTAVLGTGTENETQIEAGVWSNVTPAVVDTHLNLLGPGGEVGVQNVLADPARAGDLYAFISFQGVWRSSDFGVSWVKVNTGALGAELDRGEPLGAAIDPNVARDAGQPPTLYATSNDAEFGVFKSVDGGVNWIRQPVGTDPKGSAVASLTIDPYDSEHILGGFHNAPGLVETTDGGANWRVVPVDDGMGDALYAFFIESGDASSTRTTWLTRSKDWTQTPPPSTWRTSDSGNTWAMVKDVGHAQGGDQIFQAGGGVIYMAAYPGEGVYRSDDYGVTWALVFAGRQTHAFGTDHFVYAIGGGSEPSIARAPRGTEDWALMVPNLADAGIDYGVKNVAITHNGSHSVLVSGNWQAGIWRYEE